MNVVLRAFSFGLNDLSGLVFSAAFLSRISMAAGAIWATGIGYLPCSKNHSVVLNYTEPTVPCTNFNPALSEGAGFKGLGKRFMDLRDRATPPEMDYLFFALKINRVLDLIRDSVIGPHMLRLMSETNFLEMVSTGLDVNDEHERVDEEEWRHVNEQFAKFFTWTNRKSPTYSDIKHKFESLFGVRFKLQEWGVRFSRVRCSRVPDGSDINVSAWTHDEL